MAERKEQKQVKGRFAPSPSGRMHLGNLFSALLAWLSVRSQGGTMLLRMEDLDPDRCREEYAAQAARDLEWLGLDWDEGYGVGGPNGPYRQSERFDLYTAYAEKLELYPCYCTRAERLAASAPHLGENPDVYNGRCLRRSPEELAELAQTRRPAWRVGVPEQTVAFVDGLQGPYEESLARDCGDFILRRSDGVWAYQLAVTVDDGLMGVTEVVRGGDLLSSTPRQIWLMETMGFAPPTYTHVPLLLAPDGRRLSKRDRDMDLEFLQKTKTPEQIVGELAFLAGILPKSQPATPKELISEFSWQKVKKENLFVTNG